MKTCNFARALATTAMTLGLALPCLAVPISYQFSWTGNAGYAARGSFTYDDAGAPASVVEAGAGATSTLDSLTVSFFDPADALLQSYGTVSGGVSNSAFFQFNFDTVTESLFGALNFGGGTGVGPGDRFFSCTTAPLCRLRVIAGADLDTDAGPTAGTFLVTTVPEPATLALLVAGAVLLARRGGMSRARRREG